MDKSLEPLRYSIFSHLALCLAVSLLCVLTIEFISGRAQQWLGVWPDYADLLMHINDPLGRLRWILGDLSEATFYKHELPGLGLLAGAWLAHRAHLRDHPLQGFAICHGTGLWPWLIGSSLLSLMTSHLLWGWTLQEGNWQPTYVSFISVPAMMVMLYGEGWRVLLTGAMLGALLVTPSSLFLFNYVCVPLNLPGVTGNMLGVAGACALALALCERYPGLVRTARFWQPACPSRLSVQPCAHGLVWTIRRVLADFSEVTFFGNELASLGLLLGVVLAYLLSPASPAYGSGLVPEIIIGQALASLFGVLLWRRQWIELGWYPTYLPIVSVVPAALLIYGGSWSIILSSALLGAAVLPPLAISLNLRLPEYMHVHVGCVLAMAIGTLVLVPLVGMLGG